MEKTSDPVMANMDLPRKLNRFSFYGELLFNSLTVEGTHSFNWNNEVYTCDIATHLKQPPWTIVHYEMVNIVVALNVWKNEWRKCHIKFYVDNQSVVQICNGGYTRDAWLAACIRNIWLLTATFDITISFYHIPGYKNTVADLLSRWNNTPSQIDKLNALVPNASWKAVSTSWFHLNMEI